MRDILTEYQALSADLREAGVEEHFSRASINASINRVQPFPLTVPEQKKLQTIIRLLDDAEFLDTVRAGKITFGLIKPHANEAKSRDLTDTEVRDKIIAAIQPSLEVMVAQDFLLPRDEAEEFYTHHRGRPEIFGRLTDFMTSGAVTGLILFDENGNAVQNWRDQMGPTQPQQGEPHHLRRIFAECVENNVLHGASSTASVEAELRMFRRLLAPYCSV